MPEDDVDQLTAGLKRAAAALRDAGIPYAVGGAFAAWARGATALDHDVDIMIREEDVERAVEAVGQAGMRLERPPEGWLVKAFDGEVMVDLIFGPAGVPVTDEVLDRAEEKVIDGMPVRVLSTEDLFTTKLMALAEHSLDYQGVLELARPLREQVDWDVVRERTRQSAYARAFFTLAEGLDVIPPPDGP